MAEKKPLVLTNPQNPEGLEVLQEGDTIPSSAITSVHADKVDEGVLDPARVPVIGDDHISDVATSKLVGQVTNEQIDSVDSGKLTGTIDIARLPSDIAAGIDITNIPAENITSGVLDPDRIPVLADSKIEGIDGSKIVSGTIERARLPADIGGGGTLDVLSVDKYRMYDLVTFIEDGLSEPYPPLHIINKTNKFKPPAPVLTQAGETFGTFTISWQPTGREDGFISSKRYQIYRVETELGGHQPPKELIGTLIGRTPTTFTDTGRSIQSDYDYTVAACDDEGGVYCGVESTPIRKDRVLPPGFTSVRGETGRDQIGFTWGEVANATSYILTQTTSESSAPATVRVTGTSHVITGLERGTRYDYNIAACDVDNCTIQSSSTGETTYPPVPESITSIRIIDEDTLRVTFTAVSGGAFYGYEVNDSPTSDASSTVLSSISAANGEEVVLDIDLTRYYDASVVNTVRLYIQAGFGTYTAPGGQSASGYNPTPSNDITIGDIDAPVISYTPSQTPQTKFDLSWEPVPHAVSYDVVITDSGTRGVSDTGLLDTRQTIRRSNFSTTSTLISFDADNTTFSPSETTFNDLSYPVNTTVRRNPNDAFGSSSAPTSYTSTRTISVRARSPNGVQNGVSLFTDNTSTSVVETASLSDILLTPAVLTLVTASSNANSRTITWDNTGATRYRVNRTLNSVTTTTIIVPSETGSNTHVDNTTISSGDIVTYELQSLVFANGRSGQLFGAPRTGGSLGRGYSNTVTFTAP